MNLQEYVSSLILLAWIVYQEISWRSRLADMRSMFDNRLVVETARAYQQGLAEGELRAGRLKSFIFKRHESLGFFRKRLHEFSITLTVIGTELMSASGDLSNIDKFEIPEDLKQVILGAPKVVDNSLKVIEIARRVAAS